MMNEPQLKMILEGALLAAGRPLTLDDLLGLFDEDQRPERDVVRSALQALQDDEAERSFMLQEVASGYRLQVKRELSPWVSRLWLEKPSRYSRALLETLALVAYRQPITRGEIEDIRGVSVSSSIMKTLQEREWIRVVGHRDVPGKPAMYGTTKQFLDYFDLKSLDELPTLAELRDIDSINAELDLRAPGETADGETPTATAELESESEGTEAAADEAERDDDRNNETATADEAVTAEPAEAEPIANEDEAQMGSEPVEQAGMEAADEPDSTEQAEAADEPGPGEEEAEATPETVTAEAPDQDDDQDKQEEDPDAAARRRENG